MSKSRLEKFLYALYSLDSSDLPTPLSRIEELYNCWVTGEEAPTFKPLSRVEKYLMAILGVYDVNELPNPISRVEVLLYKLAIGDDNLDDIKSFLSEHEELLAEIIRNGGAGGNINIEYMLYTLSTEFNTLYNTAEKPVKSAILKGQTLVNYFKPLDDVNTSGSICGFQDGKIAFQFGDASFIWGSSYTAGNLSLINCLKVAPNTNYFVKLILSKPIDGKVQFGNFKESEYSTSDTITLANNKTNIYQAIMTTGTDTDYIGVNLYHSVGEIVYGELLVIPHQDGMENWDIPYFEGMQSVKMPVLTTTGKNLWDPNFVVGKRINDNGEVESFIGHACLENYISVLPNKTYSISNSMSTNGVKIFRYDNEKRLVGTSWAGRLNVTTESNVKYIRYSGILGGGGNTTEEWMKVFQLEEAPTTAYEPYKTNILSASEDVELRGIGDVRDELDLMTGEVTKRVGEVVFDGGEDWTQSGMEDPRIFYTSLNDMAHNKNYRNSISCDKFITYSGEGSLLDSTLLNGITGYLDNTDTYPNENWLYIKCADSEGSVENFKQWLSQNPVTVQYELITESVETVDISVVDQDGNNTKLSTFDDITHVTLSSEGLIPEAELEVATKNEEVLATMGLLMDDISAAQTTLEETSNTQSENVDATMLATTEIYEGLL